MKHRVVCGIVMFERIFTAILIILRLLFLYRICLCSSVLRNLSEHRCHSFFGTFLVTFQYLQAAGYFVIFVHCFISFHLFYGYFY